MRPHLTLAAVTLAALTLAGCEQGSLGSLDVATSAGVPLDPIGKPLPAPAVETLATTSCAPPDPNRVAAMLAAVNAERARLGRSPLVLEAQLQAAAQAHSCDMLRMGRATIVGSNGNSVLDRVRATGYPACAAAQNVATTGQSPAALARSMATNKLQRDNIADQKFDDIGIGAQPGPGGIWWSLVFGERC